MPVSTQNKSAISTKPGKVSGSRALVGIVQEFASSVNWLDRVRLRADRRWYAPLYHASEYDVWLISWMPGQSTGFHDHGASSGAFFVTTGTLEEHRPGEPNRVISAGDFCAFGPDYAHDVSNVSNAPSISIHAYSPPLTEMNRYELEGDRLVRQAIKARESEIHQPLGRNGALSIDQVLATARARILRLSPSEAYDAVAKNKAVLVDIRPASQRALEGSIPGALVIDRNVLEWRFDPTSSARLPVATRYDLEIIVFCSEGYTSSLAAAALQELGLWRATDIAGGVKAWREEGLPLT
jgi:rhodanese-related sulfurtransferase/quercetin dioxygenase-like cupin family protein